MIISPEAEILLHTSRTGRYVSDEALAIDLGRRGLLFDHGAQALAGGAHYLVTTPEGRKALSEWKAAQPPPPKSKRRKASPVFASWRAYEDACGRIPFAEFLKTIWPQRQYL
jgi:hypothetical protein